MSTKTTFQTRLRDSDPVPDQPFRAAFGCYVGTILTTVAVTVLLSVGFAHPAVIIATVLTLTHVSLIAGLMSIQGWTYGPERLGRDWRRWLFVLLGVALAALGLLWPRNSGAVLVTTVIGGFTTVLVGVGLARMARNRYTRVWCADEQPTVSWKAQKPRSVRLKQTLIAFVALTLVFGPLVVIFGDPGPSSFAGLYVYYGIATAIASPTNRELDVYENGLVADNKLVKGIYHWEDLDGYEVTESALRIRRSWRPDLWFDRDEIEDIDAVVAALEPNLGE